LAKQALESDLNDGLGTEEIARNLRKKLLDLNPARSRMIARTEAHNSSSEAQSILYDSLGDGFTEQWITAGGARVRDAHEDSNGQYKKDGYFLVGGEFIARPGKGSAKNAINCRCSRLIIPNEDIEQ